MASRNMPEICRDVEQGVCLGLNRNAILIEVCEAAYSPHLTPRNNVKIRWSSLPAAEFCGLGAGAAQSV